MNQLAAALALGLGALAGAPSAAQPAAPVTAPAARDAAQVLMPEDAELRTLFKDWGLADAVVEGDRVWLSGVVAGLRPGETDQVAAFDRAFARIGRILERAGVNWDDVVEITTYHSDVTAQLPDFVTAKRRYVRAPYPAWTAIDVDRLIPNNGLAEIRVVARRREAPVFYPRQDDRPFSSAVRVGKTVYLSGQLGLAPDGKGVIPGGIEAEARRTMDLIGQDLKRLGLGYDNLVKCTVFLADMQDWPAFNAVYAGYFKPGRYPARSALGANGLALGAKVEVECIAWAG